MKRDDWADLVDHLLAEVQGRSIAPVRQTQEMAWSELRRRLHRMARLLVDAGDIDDVVQVVALKLQSLDALLRMRAARSPEGYAFMMVRNASIDLARRRAREPVPFAKDRHDSLNALSTDDHLLEGLARSDQVRAVLAEQADSDKLLLTLRFWEDLSIAEIAERLKMPYSTVAVRMFRLLRRLRSRLEIDR